MPEIDDFDFEGLGSKLTNTILDSFDDALNKIQFTSIGTSLVSAFKTVDMGKVIEDNVINGDKVKTALKKVQTKLEDGFTKIKFNIGELTIPELPDQIAKVKFALDELVLPKAPNIMVAVKYLYDKFTPPKIQEVPVSVTPDTVKLASGLTEVVDKTKTAVDGIFVPRTISVDVDTTKAEKKLSSAFSTTNVPVTAVSQAAATAPQTPTISTGPLEKAGNLVREFVALTEEARKKTSVTVELYNKIVNLAQKLVATKRMEAGAVDEIIGTLQQKMDVPPVKVGAKVTSVDTSMIDEAVGKYKPIELDAKIKTSSEIKPETATQRVDIQANTSTVDSKLEQVLENFTKALVKVFDGLDLSKFKSNVNKTISSIKPTLNFGLGSNLKDDIFEVLNELKQYKQLQEALASSTLEDYQTAQKRLEVQKSLRSVGRDELVDLAKKIGITGAEYQKSGNLKNLITERLVALEKEKELRDNLLNATNDYNQAIRQANADIAIKNLTIQLHLTEQETSELALQTKNKNEALLAAGKLTDEQIKQLKANNGLLDSDVAHISNLNKVLRHRREEREIVEHVANYQLEVNEELEKYSMGWKKTKATMAAIIKDPAFAKGVFLAGAIASVEQLHHSMHEFMDVGMTAGEGVAATFKTMSVESIMGLSKSKDVLVSMVQQTGNMNTFTKDQLNTVGKMAASYGLAGEEAFGLTMAVSRMPGQTKETAVNFDKTVANVAKMKGVMPSQVMKEMAKNTGLIAQYSKGGVEGFAKAAASAKKMGVELSTVLGAAKKTLDFESSINAQLEASVLLGKEINLDRLRQATLSGDANAVLQEQQNLIRQVGGLDRMNLLEKEKLAEAMGMTVEDLTKISKAQQDGTLATEDQASAAEEGLGKVLKLGGGLVTGFGAIAPMLMTITSLMSIMNSGTALGGMVKGMSNFVGSTYEALKGLGKMVVLNVGKALGFSEGSKEKAGGIIKSAFGKKTPEVPKPEAPGGGGAGPADQADKVSKIKSGDLLKGAAALLIVSAALYVAAKAFQEFASVKWEDVGKGLVGISGLALVAMLLGKVQGQMIQGAIAVAILGAALIPMAFAFQMIAGIKPEDLVTFGVALVSFSLAAAGLGFAAGFIIAGAAAIGILGLALIPMAAAFKMVEGLDPNALVTFGLAIVGFSMAAAGLALISPLIIIGAEAIAVLGFAMLPFAAAIALAGPSVKDMSVALKDLANTKGLTAVGDALFTLAKGLFQVGIAGMMALPTLNALQKLSAAPPTSPVVPSGPTTSATVAPKAAAPVATPIAAAPPTTTTAPAATAAQPAKQESSSDMKAMMDKLDKLISVLQQGGTINMDGKKVADIVQRNIRTVKFAD
jgi:hypothetical protein